MTTIERFYPVACRCQNPLTHISSPDNGCRLCHGSGVYEVREVTAGSPQVPDPDTITITISREDAKLLIVGLPKVYREGAIGSFPVYRMIEQLEAALEGER